VAIPMTIRAKSSTVVHAPPAPMTDGFGPTKQVATITPGEIMEQVLIKGDLKNLSDGERARYYSRVCESVGLNPLTRPLEYITLNGKLTLYARKDCTDQLRTIHKVSVIDTEQQEMDGVYIIICKVQNAEGRTDIARGAVTLAGLKGEALANQIMKCETKAKRRATLSICGLGFLDETEIEDIDEAPKRKSSSGAKKDGTADTYNTIIKEIRACPDCDGLAELRDKYAQELATLPTRWGILASQEYEARWVDLGGMQNECPFPALDDQL
jgi:hypothetical protein